MQSGRGESSSNRFAKKCWGTESFLKCFPAGIYTLMESGWRIWQEYGTKTMQTDWVGTEKATDWHGQWHEEGNAGSDYFKMSPHRHQMKVGNEMSIHAPSTLAPRILCTGSESSKTTKPKLGSFPPTPLVLIRSSTTLPYAGTWTKRYPGGRTRRYRKLRTRKRKRSYSWRTPWAQPRRCRAGGCRQKAGGCRGTARSVCCPRRRSQGLFHLEAVTNPPKITTF